MYADHYQEPSRSKNKSKTGKSKKIKKLSKLIASDSDTDADSEHELSYYMKDRVKLMKEVLKIMKPKRIKRMTPDCMKDMDIQEINSILLEELLGISNKRLKYIFEGKILDEESSTDDDDDQSVDIISLDEITDDDFVVISDDEDDHGKHSKHRHRNKKIKLEGKGKSKKIKKEKSDKVNEIEKVKNKLSQGEKPTSQDKETIGEENLMSVLELLELQARARAIRSQLELESKQKEEEKKLAQPSKEPEANQDDDDDEVIIEVPKDVEIVISSSDTENEEKNQNKNSKEKSSINQSKDSEENVENQSENISEKEDGQVESEGVDSDNDNLQVIKEREQKKLKYKNLEKPSGSTQTESDSPVTEEGTKTIPETLHSEEKSSEANQTVISSADAQNKTGKLDEVIEEYMKNQPPAADTSNDQGKAEEEKIIQEQQTKITKEKRLKKFKSKLQSYKQDVAVETTVNVLEDIIIKPSVSKFRKPEEEDGLVINVDQDDIDCMICD